MNTTNTMKQYGKRFGLAVLISALAGGAIAAEPNADDSTLLKGPEVVETTGPENGDTMSGSNAAAHRNGDVPLRAYLGAIRAMIQGEAEESGFALTDEQKDEIRAIGKAHREQMQAYMAEHKEELAEFPGMRGEHGQRGLRGQRGPEGQRGQRGSREALSDSPPPPSDKNRRRAHEGAGGPPPSMEDRKEMREKMAAIMADAPSDQDAKKQLWSVLTPDQQAAVKERVAEHQAKRQQRMDAQQEQRAKRDRGEGKRDGQKKKGKEQGMADPIFDIDKPVPMLDDC